MRFLACTLALACSTPVTLAQTMLFERHGDTVGDGFGASARMAGDVDGDGRDDWIVGAPADDVVGQESGSATVFSGATGDVLHEHHGAVAFDRFGMAVAGAGDVDADGFADVIVGAPFDFFVGTGAGSASVFSGRDGTLLFRFEGDAPGDRFGTSVASAGDLDRDGHADLIVGAPLAATSAGRPGIARVFSGVDGRVLWTVSGANDGDQFGFSVAAFGDVDGDGVRDFAAGAPLEAENGVRTGSLRAFSGAGGQELWARFGEGENNRFGHAVAAMGDVTNDGRPELVVGAPLARFAAGVVRVLSGATGAQQYLVQGVSRDVMLGGGVGGVQDWNGDGVADFVAGADHSYQGGIVSGYVGVFSGADGAPLFEHQGIGGTYFGSTVDGAGDTDGDGLSEIVVGGYRGNGNRGSAFVFTPAGCPPPTPSCTTSPNSAGAGALIAAHGSTSLAANDLTLTARGGPPHEFGLFIHGSSADQVPLGEGVLCLGGDIHRIAPAVQLDARGNASRTVDLQAAAGAVQAGDTWHFQLWYRDAGGGPAGYNFSDAVVVRFCP